MANPFAGEVALVVDGQRFVCKLTLGALAELEASLGSGSLVELVERFEGAAFSSRDVLALIAFFEARQGELIGFRWKDWGDFKSCLPSAEVSAFDQIIGAGNDVAAVYPLRKTYASGGVAYFRPILKPVAGTVRVAVGGDPLQEGVEYFVDTATGLVTIVYAPVAGALVTAGFEFDTPVRFDIDRIQTSVSSFKAGQVPNVPIVEVRI